MTSRNPYQLFGRVAPVAIGRELRDSSELGPVFFDFDSPSLGPAEEAALRRNAAWLKKHPYVAALVAGYCDERGSLKHNQILGRLRAEAVKEYYVKLGIIAERLTAVSEVDGRSVCPPGGEDCWRKNRRAETLIATVRIEELPRR